MNRWQEETNNFNGEKGAPTPSPQPKAVSRSLMNRVARSIFAVAGSLGISDRSTIERITRQVLQRLAQSRSQPLPGMEALVTSEKNNGNISAAQIRAIVREVLSQEKPGQVALPVSTSPKEESPQVPRPSRGEENIDLSRLRGLSRSSELSKNALTVLERRYLKKDSEGRVIETPDQMFYRVARNIAEVERLYDPAAEVAALEAEFYQVMKNLEFLPNSPTLMNAGRELQQLSACFVIPIEDSMESIFDAVKFTALIHKSGGGTGFSFSRLRPEKDRVGSTGGVASGPVSFMRAFDTATDVIKQGGMRRGANMGILNVEHPDILRFIEAKKDGQSFSNFNLSVAVTEAFMKAVDKDEEYDLINPRTKKVVSRLKAREVFDRIVDSAWRTGDPGIVFLDRINQDNPTPHLGAIESTNPCGEQPLLPFESCNLGSLNLARLITEEKGGPTIDWEKLNQRVHLAVRFLDNVIDANHFPLPQIEAKTKATRKIGLGIMGFADLLIQLGIPYNSEEALDVGARLMSFISEEATAASAALAEKRGPFPAFKSSVYDRPGTCPLRNATRTTIAPTGTLSIIANASSGIEPLFAVSYIRTVLDGDQLVEVNPYFEEIARREGFSSEELMRKLASRGSVQGLEEIPTWAQRLFVVAHDITPEWHVRMQAAFQRCTDNAVSKTVNFPHDATRENVARVYMLAYREGCKGITIYRDRSKDRQVLATVREGKDAAATETKVAEEEVTKIVPRERPARTTGVTQKIATGCGNLYVTINYDEQGMCEVFASLGNVGGCASAQLQAIGRLISLALRSGVDAQYIAKYLRGIRCPAIAWDQGHAVLSCPDAVGGVLEKEIGGTASGSAEGSLPLEEKDFLRLADLGQCPECSSQLIYQEGCLICRSCGYTRCG